MNALVLLVTSDDLSNLVISSAKRVVHLPGANLSAEDSWFAEYHSAYSSAVHQGCAYSYVFIRTGIE
jgi:hypothetical protein